MKIGLNLDNRGPGATPENLIRFAVAADRLGFSSLAVSDHVVLVRRQTTQYPYSTSGEIDFDAWTPWNDTLGLIGFVAGKQLAWIGDRYKLITTDRGATWAVFDLGSDPGEARDIAAEHPEVEEKMRGEVGAWIAEVAPGLAWPALE